VASTTSSTSIRPQNEVPRFTDRSVGIPESALKVTNSDIPIDEDGNIIEADEQMGDLNDSDEEREYLDPIQQEHNARNDVNDPNNDPFADVNWQNVQTKQVHFTKTRSGGDIRAPIVPLLQRR